MRYHIEHAWRFSCSFRHHPLVVWLRLRHAANLVVILWLFSSRRDVMPRLQKDRDPTLSVSILVRSLFARSVVAVVTLASAWSRAKCGQIAIVHTPSLSNICNTSSCRDSRDPLASPWGSFPFLLFIDAMRSASQASWQRNALALDSRGVISVRRRFLLCLYGCSWIAGAGAIGWAACRAEDILHGHDVAYLHGTKQVSTYK